MLAPPASDRRRNIAAPISSTVIPWQLTNDRDFVDKEAAARFLALKAHTLEFYRLLGGGPAYRKKWVRQAVDDLDEWAESCWLATTASSASSRFPILTKYRLQPIWSESSNSTQRARRRFWPFSVMSASN